MHPVHPNFSTIKFMDTVSRTHSLAFCSNLGVRELPCDLGGSGAQLGFHGSLVHAFSRSTLRIDG